MTKGGERPFDNPGDLTLFDMDFTTDGLAWAGNMYQKWDNLRLGDLFVQKPREYVDALGEHVKELLDDVAKDWLNRSGKSLEGPVSDLSLEHDVIADVCKKSEDSEQGSLVNDQVVKEQSGTQVQPAFSSLQDSCPNEFLNLPLEVNQRESLVQSSSEVASTHCSIGDSCQVAVHEDGSGAYVGNAIPSPDAMFSELHPTDTRNYDDSACEQASIKHDVSYLSTEIMEGFEDVKLEHFINDVGEHDLSLISHHSPKRISYKKKLKQAFRSKVWSSRNRHEQFYGSSTMAIRDGGTHASVVLGNNLEIPKNEKDLDLEVSTGSSCENGWEIL